MRAFVCIWFAISFAPLAAAAQGLPDSPQPDSPQWANPQPASADDAEWNRVQKLANGQEIEISTGGAHPRHCLFAGATRTLLFCDSRWFWRSGDEFRFERDELESVRMDQQRRNRWIITLAATGAGFGIGYASAPGVQDRPNIPRAEYGLAGSLLGALGGWATATIVSPSIPGKLVYRHKGAQP